MRHISTRGGSDPKSFSEILLEGLAPDGGLYVPEEYPMVSSNELEAMRSMSYPELAFSIISRFADDIPSEDLKRMIKETYTKETFGSDEIVPVKKLEDNLYILGLSEGPTLAFKDIPLQLLGRLFEHVLGKRHESLNILGATSGDTGSAAEYAMQGRKAVNVFMLSPHGRMTEFQRKQMYTLQDPNIFNIAIKGTFDDCQDIVKTLNEDAEFKKKYKLGAVNSMNFARVAAQLVYFFWAYLRVTKTNREKVAFTVPTGNFGDILTGYIASNMGLPVRRLVLATNENDVLVEFFNTGVYRPRKGVEVYSTSSPSMDVSKASNFERYLFDLVGRNAARVNELVKSLSGKGAFTISVAEMQKLKEDIFVAGSSTHADRLRTIASIYEKYHVLVDPHTADGVKVGLEHREQDIPLICLETAQPAKFARTIREAIGRDPEIPAAFSKLVDLSERFEVIGADIEAVRSYIVAHS